jgi:6,7-dimethyl-8-ribityllumazine synthase
MPKVLQGNMNAAGKKFGIVVSRFNEFITGKLIDGALDGLTRHGTNEGDIDIVWVPGAFEIPVLARRMADSKKYDAVICLGCVIKGDTPHFDYVAAEVERLGGTVVQQGHYGDLAVADERQLHDANGSRDGEERHIVSVSGNEEDSAAAGE